jgi:hypothetical protein
MKTLITDLSNEFCISVNDLMVFQQTMPTKTYTGVGKRTWFTEEGVELVRKHFTGPHCESSLIVGQVIGQCKNPRMVYATIPNQEGKVIVKIPARLVGKLDKKRINIEKIVHATETLYQWAKVDQNANVS